VNVDGGTFLVTGGASLIGFHVVEALLEAGAVQVRVLDNLSSDTSAAIDQNLAHRDRIEVIRGDVLRITDVLDAVAGTDGVFHGAALITQPIASQPETGMDVNVRGTAVLLAAAAHLGARKVILMSSVSVYGSAVGLGINERMPFVTEGLGWPSQLYGGGKLLAEGLCRAYADKSGLSWVALRAPSVYGTFQHGRGLSSAKLAQIWAALRGHSDPVLPVDPEEAHDFIYVTDVADAVVAALRSDVSGVAMNVSSGESVSYAQVVGLLQEIIGSRPVRFAGPAAGVHLTATTELSYDRSAARQLLGWEPRVPLREGLERLVRWLDEETSTDTAHVGAS